ncbi:MAG TPA: homocysteine S-methyltransferase family protein [Gaiellales bacterium]|nr:homocysteine S-methyltransferase family protein [Gaiellales bacterium]
MSNRSDGRVARLHERLAGGEVVIMDGGTGTGLQAMGVPMDGEAWGGVANLTHLDAVQRLHAAYLAAGARILITNTFATGPGPLAAARYGERFAEANRNAVAAAMQARSEAGEDDVVVAGSMSRDVANGLAATGVPFDVSDNAAALRDGYRRQAEVLAGAGVDLIVLEMMGSRTHLEPAFAAASETGLPVWMGLSIGRAGDGQAETIDGEDACELIASLPAGPIDAAFVMHSDVDLVPAALAALRAVWPGTLGAYPHVGDWEPPNWVFREIAPADFARRAHEWVAAGATIVGGCCGTGPDHIAALAAAFAV